MDKFKSICIECGKPFERLEILYSKTYEEKYLCDSCRNIDKIIVFNDSNANPDTTSND